MLIYVPLPINMFKFGMFSYMKLSIRGKGKHIFFSHFVLKNFFDQYKRGAQLKKKKKKTNNILNALQLLLQFSLSSIY